MIVVDTNVLAARNLTSVSTWLAEQVESLDPVWIVPPLWRYEFQNILAKTLRVRQISLNDALTVWKKASTRMADNEHEPSPERVIGLSNDHGITGYDANFVALAQETGVLCVTEDAELHRKFPVMAVSMADFVKTDRNTAGVRESHAPYRTRKRHAGKK